MKYNKKFFSIYAMVLGLVTTGLVGCASVADKYVKITDRMGLSPSYDKVQTEPNGYNVASWTPQQKQAIIYNGVFVNYPITKSLPLPKDTPNGSYTHYENGVIAYKTIAKNQMMSEFVDLYYPDGKLHTHTLLENGLAQGWSDGYDKQGNLMSKMRYHQGKVVEWQKIQNNKVVLSGIIPQK